VAQLSLFGNGPRRLLDDRSGCIEYRPGWAAPDDAREWFEALRTQVPWRAQRRLMYEREVAVPRLLASYRLDATLPSALAAIAARIAAEFATPFDSVGLNLYRDRHDSVAPHNDRLHELQPGHPILLLSLGATRRMVIQAKAPPRRVLGIELEAGSLLSMSWDTQLHYDHGVPKQRTPVGERISLAFRVRGRAGEAAGDDLE
jgi:alkylated DNA repair dioxygenase AlkB